MLLAGGYAPAFPEHELNAPPLSAVNDAINAVLEGHLPVPGDRGRPALGAGRRQRGHRPADGRQRGATCSSRRSMRCGCRCIPKGWPRASPTCAQWRQHLLHRLAHQVEATGDPVLAAASRGAARLSGGTQPGQEPSGPRGDRGAAALSNAGMASCRSSAPPPFSARRWT